MCFMHRYSSPEGPNREAHSVAAPQLGLMLSQVPQRTEKPKSGPVRLEQQGPGTGCGSSVVPTFETIVFP